MKTLGIAFCILILFTSAVLNSLEAQWVAGELLVQFDKKLTREEVEAFLRGSKNINFKQSRLLSGRMNAWLIVLENKSSELADAMQEIQSMTPVKAIQPNHYIEQREIFPDDPYFNDQWGLYNNGNNGGVVGADVDAVNAWEITTGGYTVDGDEIVVAIIDSGCDLTHPDLGYWKNVNEIPGNGIDDDNNGYIDDYDGWNAYNHTGQINSSSHGTHVAGISSAIGNNNLGVSGVNWNSKVMPILGSSNSEAVVVEAYGYVLEMRSLYNETNGELGSYVVSANSSFGVNYGNPANFPIWAAMYDSLGNAGVLSCGATANMDVNVDVSFDMPTACTSDFLISVTNTTRQDQKNATAGYGAVSIDLGAPGTQIRSTDQNSSYSYKTGTSMSSPFVAGAVALLYSAIPQSVFNEYSENPGELALFVKDCILSGTDPLPALEGITVTGGRLNLYNSLLLANNHFEVGGAISEDVVWNSSIVYVVDNVVIENNASVSIPEGTIIFFDGEFCIDVYGSLFAEGTNEQQIVFTVFDSTGFYNTEISEGSWKGIRLIGSGNDSSQVILEHCKFAYAKKSSVDEEDFSALFIDNYPNITISDCLFQNNIGYEGGALKIIEAEIDVTGCRFINNSALASGGAIYSDESTISISDCGFETNTSVLGGAVSFINSEVSLNTNEFIENCAQGNSEVSAGALYLQETSGHVTGNIFVSNSAEESAGAVGILNSSNLTLLKNEFDANNGSNKGGAIYLSGSDGIFIVNNLIVNNLGLEGGAVSLQSSTAELYNNTIINNYSLNGGALFMYESNAVLMNNICYTNFANQDGAEFYISDSNLEISFCNYENADNSIFILGDSSLDNENNIFNNPEFSNGELYPYQLSQNSPCVDSGNPASNSWSYLPQTDLAGNNRIIGEIIDIGAYEYYAVNSDAPGVVKNSLISNYPNPFNPAGADRSNFTRIKFFISDSEINKVNIEIFNILGQKIKTITSAEINRCGYFEVNWNGRNEDNEMISSGVYLYSLVIDNKRIETKKMMVLR
ncbi:MAG: S8 family serine peptidase [Candidatus Cloacimonetes bacterium]|nr:S8 family serine peptidase [Candidatus Cloacimonadota bacterium]